MPNRNKLNNLIIFSIIFFGVLFFAKTSLAAITLPWSTTYNCTAWDGTYCTINCDNLQCAGSWACTDADGTTHRELITADANYSGGGGGKGQRHWKGNTMDECSGDTKFAFASVQPEIWMRFYMRYQAGFAWSNLNNDKIIHLFDDSGAQFVFGFYGSDKIRFEGGVGNLSYHSADGNGWTTIMGGATGDGLWHCYEFHVNFATGVGDIWVDGVLRYHTSSINFSGRTGLMYGYIGSNNNLAANATCAAVDFDDIVINNTGYIGPLPTTPDTTPPAAPTGVTVS